MRSTSFKYAVILALPLLSAPCAAQTEVYKYVDKDGNVTYSNTRQKDAKKHELPPLTVVPPIKAPKESGIRNPSAVEDNEARRKEIEEKIAEEIKFLEQIRKEYNGGEPERIGGEANYQKYLDRVQRLKDNIALHEKTIETLRLELRNLASPGKK
jgi:hypothetical protein